MVWIELMGIFLLFFRLMKIAKQAGASRDIGSRSPMTPPVTQAELVGCAVLCLRQLDNETREEKSMRRVWRRENDSIDVTRLDVRNDMRGL